MVDTCLRSISLLLALLIILLEPSLCRNGGVRTGEATSRSSRSLDSRRLTQLYGPAYNHKPPAYFINLDSNRERKLFMSKHLKEAGFHYIKRVDALTAKTCNLIMLESSCYRRVGFHEIAIVCSHLSALYQAVITDQSEYAKNSPYALILEDDVRFYYDIDFDALIDQAPKNFGMIQLMMSHTDHIIEQTHMYFDHNELFGIRYRNSTVWSAQAILVNKAVVRPFILNAVRPDQLSGNLGYIIAGSYHFEVPNQVNNPFKPSIASQCIFSDMFLYSMGEPAYILNIPLMNGAGLGLNSSSHSTHVPFHIHGFAEIESIHKFLSHKSPLPNPYTTSPGVLNPNPSSLLPSFVKQFPPGTLSDIPFNWTAMAIKTTKPVFPGVKAFKIRDH